MYVRSMYVCVEMRNRKQEAGGQANTGTVVNSTARTSAAVKHQPNLGRLSCAFSYVCRLQTQVDWPT